MPGAFLYDNVARFAALSSDEATVGAMPLSNLQDPQPRRRARLMGSSASVIADMGVNVSVDCAALISTTLGAGATVRARVGSEAALVEAAPIVDLDFMAGALPSGVTFSRASLAWFFNESGLLVQAANNVARFDHDQVTRTRRGLLMEPARTNIALWSRDLTQSAWVKTNVTAALDVEGIDGATNAASSLAATSANGTALQTIASASSARVASFFVRRIAGAGAVEITQNNGATWSAITLTAAWQRFVIPVATGANPVIGFRLATSGDVVAVDVAQSEVGTFATSPIITGASAATRAAETATMPVSVPENFSILREAQHVAFLGAGANATLGLMGVDAGNSSNSFYFRLIDAALPYVDLRAVAGVEIKNSANFTVTIGQIIRQAAAYAPSDMAVSVNGGGIDIDTSGALPGMTRILINQAEAISYERRIRLYGSRLSNAQLIALSGTGSTLVPAEITGDTGAIAAEAEDANQGNVILTLPAPVVGRYLRIDISNPTAAFTDIGVLAAGALWRLLRGTAYGIREGRVMLDRRDRNPFTGAEFPVPAIANPRMAAFTLPSLSTSEARNQHRALIRLLGAAGDALWIAELNDTLAERNRRAIWGAVNVPGEDAAVSRDSFPLSSRAFRVTERL